MSIFISLVIFALGLFLFFITNNKLKKIKDNLLIDDTRKEIESLITEFNGAAARNIELLESKISELQEMINRANSKMTHLDDKIGRANRPFVVERVMDKAVSAPSSPNKTHWQEESARPVSETKPAEPAGVGQKNIPVKNKPSSLREAPVRADRQDKKPAIPAKKEPVKAAMQKRTFAGEMNGTAPSEKAQPAAAAKAEPQTGSEPLTRHEQLKKHIRDGLSKQELIALGFMENEINLLNFLIKKKV